MHTDFITLLGDVKIPAPNKHFRRIPEEYILYLIRDGHMTLVENNTVYELYPGDILLLEPSLPHYGIQADSSIEYSFLHFSMDSYYSMAKTFDEGGELKRIYDIKKLSFSPEQFQEIITLFEAIRDVYHSAAPYQGLKMQSLFTMFLIQLLEHHSYNANSTGNAPEYRSCTPRLSSQKLSEFLRQNCRKVIRSRDLEEVFHHNFDYMNRVFKVDFGMTIFQYLENYRIEESKKMLRTRAFTIAQVAESLGFCNTYYFSRVFKKRTGIAPSYWNKNK